MTHRFNNTTITAIGTALALASISPVAAQGPLIDFGDNSGSFPRDGECDDMRFVHAESAGKIYLFDDVGHDADDCKAGFKAGTLRWQGDLANPVRGLTSDELGDELDDDWDYIF